MSRLESHLDQVAPGHRRKDIDVPLDERVLRGPATNPEAQSAISRPALHAQPMGARGDSIAQEESYLASRCLHYNRLVDTVAVVSRRSGVPKALATFAQVNGPPIYSKGTENGDTSVW